MNKERVFTHWGLDWTVQAFQRKGFGKIYNTIFDVTTNQLEILFYLDNDLSIYQTAKFLGHREGAVREQLHRLRDVCEQVRNERPSTLQLVTIAKGYGLLELQVLTGVQGIIDELQTKLK